MESRIKLRRRSSPPSPLIAAVGGAITGVLALAAAPCAIADVNGPGPSDPSLFDTVINLPPDPDIGDDASIGGVVGETTQLNLADGGAIGSRFGAGSGSEVNLSGGAIGVAFEANLGSEINISGGAVGSGFRANAGSVVNVAGGAVGRGFTARSGSVVNFNGGTVDRSFYASSGSDVDIRGGTFGRFFITESDSDVELIGGEFTLNGAAYTEANISLSSYSSDDVFTGTLADGTAFIFTPWVDDSLHEVGLTTVALPLPESTPIVVDAASPAGPSGLRAGQSLTLQPGGVLGDNFEVVDATLNVAGGSLGAGAGAAYSEVSISGGNVGGFIASASVVEISGGTVEVIEAYTGSELYISGGNVVAAFVYLGSEVIISGGNVEDAYVRGGDVTISGGTIGDHFEAHGGSVVNITGGAVGDYLSATGEVNISGGSVGDFFDAEYGSEVNISGGTIGRLFDAMSGSVVNIRGGFVGDHFEAHGGSVVNISGGTVDSAFHAGSGSEINLLGSEFFLDGEMLDALVFDEPLLISERGVTLTGVLADGSSFAFELDPSDVAGRDYFSTDAELTVSLVTSGVPEPSGFVLLVLGGVDRLVGRRRGLAFGS